MRSSQNRRRMSRESGVAGRVMDRTATKPGSERDSGQQQLSAGKTSQRLTCCSFARAQSQHWASLCRPLFLCFYLIISATEAPDLIWRIYISCLLATRFRVTAQQTYPHHGHGHRSVRREQGAGPCQHSLPAHVSIDALSRLANSLIKIAKAAWKTLSRSISSSASSSPSTTPSTCQAQSRFPTLR